MMRRPRYWLFDLDDTLMWNSYTYNQPLIDLINYLTGIFQNRIPYIGSISRFQEEIDSGLAKKNNPRTGAPYMFSKDRFPDSLALTYRWLCEKGFGIYDQTVADKCHEIGMQAFDEKNYQMHGLVPGAESVLNFLHERHPLALVTKGDDWVQNKKIKALGLQHWFSGNIYVVAEKTPEVYRHILSSSGIIKSEHERPPQGRVIMVGNSFSGDIRPALQAGLSALFIPCMTWLGECNETNGITEEERSRMMIFETISEIIPWYKKLR